MYLGRVNSFGTVLAVIPPMQSRKAHHTNSDNSCEPRRLLSIWSTAIAASCVSLARCFQREGEYLRGFIPARLQEELVSRNEETSSDPQASEGSIYAGRQWLFVWLMMYNVIVLYNIWLINLQLIVVSLSMFSNMAMVACLKLIVLGLRALLYLGLNLVRHFLNCTCMVNNTSTLGYDFCRLQVQLVELWVVLGQPNTFTLLHKLYCTRTKLVVATSKVHIVWLCPRTMAVISSFSLIHRESEQLSNTELDNVYGLAILLS